MRIRWLGTAAAEGWPGIFCECGACARARAEGGKNIRTRSSLMVDTAYKVDMPPDTYHHVLTHGLNLAEVEWLFMTHSHGDHLNPWELAMRHPPFAHFKDRPLTIMGNEAVKAEVFAAVGERARNFKFIVPEPFVWHDTGDGRAMALLADHDPHQQCLFYVLEVRGKRLLVGNDTGYFPEESWNALAGLHLDVVSLDCTNGPLPGRRNHMDFDCICEVRERLTSIGAAGSQTSFVATHFSHNGGLMHSEMEAVLNPKGFAVAFDGMEVVV